MLSQNITVLGICNICLKTEIKSNKINVADEFIQWVVTFESPSIHSLPYILLPPLLYGQSGPNQLQTCMRQFVSFPFYNGKKNMVVPECKQLSYNLKRSHPVSALFTLIIK